MLNKIEKTTKSLNAHTKKPPKIQKGGFGTQSRDRNIKKQPKYNLLIHLQKLI